MNRQPPAAFRVRASLGATALYSCLAAALAGCAAFGACGVRECPADAKISAEVRTLLAQSPALGTPNLVSVQTVHGVVYLRGLVSTPYQIGEAGSIAGRAPGVTDVQNLLTIDNSR
ncbi:MAG TPA: BON domain-containing protein [Steroidobacteraceae bacterium]|jgi:osmotically-inducible protein OsmY